jgi:hypothetical protein
VGDRAGRSRHSISRRRPIATTAWNRRRYRGRCCGKRGPLSWICSARAAAGRWS